MAEHNETWLDLASAGQFDGQGDHHSPKPYVRKAFEKYLECSIFAHGRDGGMLDMVLRIFLRVNAQTLRGRAARGTAKKCANRKISGDWP